MKQAFDRREVCRLASLTLDGSSTVEDWAHLESMLVAHDDARQVYYQAINLHSQLAWNLGERAEKSKRPLLGILERATAALNRPVYWATLAAGILFAGYLTLVSWNMLESSRHAPSAVAELRETEDAKWSPGSRLTAASKQGEPVKQGEPLQITSGIVELQLKQGTTLIVEGPAEWSIDGENSATLKLGKLIAKVPQQAVGFTLDTPSSRIVDLGTEFGVEVGERGAADVHVVKGEVDVQPAGDARKAGPGKLQAGQSVQITPAGVAKVVNSPTLPDKFQRLVDAGNKKEQIAAKPPAGSPLGRWHEASQKLRTDPSLVAYYDFEQQGETLRNVAADKLHGEIKASGKASRTHGRWHGKGALAFGEQFAHVVVTDDPTLLPDGDWSMWVWFRVDALPRGYALIAGKGIFPKRSYSLWHHSSGSIQFTANGSNGTYYICTPPKPLSLNHWYLVVGVIEAGKMRLYVNGEEACDAQPIFAKIAVDDQPLRLGRSTEPTHSHPFTGAINELAIFRRALTAKEVETLYEQGRNE